MTTLPTLLSRQRTLTAELATIEAAIKTEERAYWSARGYTVMPRRERLHQALQEDAFVPTPLEAYLEQLPCN